MAINPYQSVLPGTEGNVIPKINPYQSVIPGTTGNVLTVPPPATTTLSATNIGVAPIQLPKTLTPIVPTMPAPLAPTEGGVQLTQNAGGTASSAPTPVSVDQQATNFAQAQTPVETPAEAQQTQLQSRFTQLYEKLFGKPKAQQEAETAQGIPEKSKAVADIQAQINQLQNDAAAATIRAQQMGETSGFGDAQARQIERDRTVKALQLNSFLFAAQGNLATAQDMADRAVKAQFEPAELEINYLREFLDMNEKNMDRADKKRAEALRLQLDERTRLLDEQKAERTAINSISIEAAQAGADALMLNKINSATTQEEALQIAASDPKLLSWAKQMQEAKFEEEKRQFGMTYALAAQKATKEDMTASKAEREALAMAEEKIPGLQDKVANIANLKTHAGMRSSVGAYGITRWTPLSIDKSARQDFIAGIEQIVSKDTLDTLLNLKAQGGTLGALSDQERLMLQSAASKIGTWRIVGDDGKVNGYEVGRDAFNKELETIKTLAERALNKAQGTLIKKDEKAALDSMFGNSDAFDPSLYF